MRNGAVAGYAERGLVRIGFQPGDELLEVLDLGRDGRADEDTELEPRELTDRNEILRRVKLGVVSTIGSRYIVGPVVTRMVVPSGLAPFTALMPISPSPPVRFRR